MTVTATSIRTHASLAFVNYQMDNAYDEMFATTGVASRVAFDPTNNLLGSERHIHVAVGRHYADVPPMRGAYKRDAESELSLTVAPVDAPQPKELPPAMVLRTKRSELRTASTTDQQQQQQ